MEFEAAYALYWPYAVTVAGRILRNRERAEDAAADAFVKVWRNWGLQRDARSYIAVATIRVALDAVQREQRIQLEDIDALPELAGSEDHVRVAEHSETLREVAGALGRIYPSYAAALRLRVAGYGYREIAAIRGLTEMSAKQAVVKARRQFERAWAATP